MTWALLDTFEPATASAPMAPTSRPTTTFRAISAPRPTYLLLSSNTVNNNHELRLDNFVIDASAPATITKTNQAGDPNPLVDGVPPDLVVPADGFTLDPGDTLTVTYTLQVDDPMPAGVTSIDNKVTIYSNETPFPGRGEDDIPATAVHVEGFGALDAGGRTVLEWRTAFEAGTVGFYVYRRDGGKWEPVRDAVVPALVGRPDGGRYRLVDEAQPAGGAATYVLLEVEGSGRDSHLWPVHGDAAADVACRDCDAVLDERHRTPAARRRPAGAAAHGERSRDARGRAAEAGARSRDRDRYRRRAAWALRGAGGDHRRVDGSPEAVVRGNLARGSFSLQSHGRPVSWITTPGGADLVFYGEALDSPYSERDVYRLGPGSGESMQSSGRAGGPRRRRATSPRRGTSSSKRSRRAPSADLGRSRDLVLDLLVASPSGESADSRSARRGGGNGRRRDARRCAWSASPTAPRATTTTPRSRSTARRWARRDGTATRPSS